MRTINRTRLMLPGTRARIYEIELVEQSSTREARYLVNFRYGWEGSVLEEGTRTPDPVTYPEAVRVFESVIVARRNQGYQSNDAIVPERKTPALSIVKPSTPPREAILGRRLRGFDTLPDLKAAALLRRIGEVRLTGLHRAVENTARAVIAERKRLVTLRVLPYVVHRTDDGSGTAAGLLEQLSSIADVPTAEMALMLRTVRDAALAPTWSLYPPVLQAAVGNLPDAAMRRDAVIAFFQSAIATFDRRRAIDAADGEKALRMLYAHSAHDPTARDLVLAVLTAVPLDPPLFRTMRRILQVAETIDDAEAFAILNARFDNDKPRHVVVPIDPNNPRRGSHATYGQRTRQYLRRRGWRTLRRLGDVGDAAYVSYASAILLTLDDARVSDADQLAARKLKLPDFPDRYAAHKILHADSAHLAPSDRSLRWRFTGSRVTAGSANAAPYQSLWSARPQALWRLVRDAKTLDVATFAAVGLTGHASFTETVSSADIATLIGHWQPFSPRLDLAMALAEKRIARDGVSRELAAALMAEPIRGGALMQLVLAARSDVLVSDPQLFATMLVHCAEQNFVWFKPLAHKAATDSTPAAQTFVLDRVLTDLHATSWPISEIPRAKALASVLTASFGSAVASLDGARLRQLSRQASEPLQLIAAKLAAVHADGANQIDVGALATSSNPELKAAGIEMFARRPLHALAADIDAVAAFLTADDAAPRAAARPIAARLQAERPDAARSLAETLLPALYRAQEHDGLRDDVLAVLAHELKPSVVALGVETVWTLMRARAEPARRLGAEMLDAFAPRDFSIRQLARIGCNDQVKARRWAIAALQTRIDDVKAAPEEGFALLDCAFDDTREAGYALYRTHLTPEDWTPTALVALADSTTESAQRFGREMIGRVFEAKNADFLLSRLAEHPAAGFRLLVARLMRDYVKDDTQRLKKLVPAIETTLLQVRKGRAAKHQVLSFIEEQVSKRSEEATGQERLALLAPILERTVATCAIDDRARLLALLTAIKQRSPELAPRVTLIAREAR